MDTLLRIVLSAVHGHQISFLVKPSALYVYQSVERFRIS